MWQRLVPTGGQVSWLGFGSATLGEKGSARTERRERLGRGEDRSGAREKR